jgi:hypothetical protein
MLTFLSALNYLSPLRYSIRNLAPYSLRDIAFSCDAQQRLPDGSCTISSGAEALQLYSLALEPGWLAAYVLLRVVRTSWSWNWDSDADSDSAAWTWLLRLWRRGKRGERA